MANIEETSGWPNVPLLATRDLVLGGVDGPSNAQAIALTARANQLRDNQKRTPLHFATLAEAESAAATLSDGQLVEALVNDATLQYVVSAGSLVKIPARSGDGPLNVRQFIESPIDGITSNQDGIIAAVAAAYAIGAQLEWSVGTYVSTANIPNFWGVHHVGRGVIKRDAHTFKLNAKGSQESTVFVSTLGSDDNDGFSPGFAKRTVQGVLNVFNSPFIDTQLAGGIFKIQFGEGTWTDGGSFTGNINSKNYVYIQGITDSNGKPLTIIDGASSTKTAGIYLDGGPSQIYLKDIESNNFRSNSVASGFVLANKGIAKAYADNLWGSNNLWAGLNADSVGQFNMRGGTLDGNTEYNLRVRGNVAISIGRPEARITLKNSTGASVQIRDCCSGHFDYVDITNHPTTPIGTGVWVTNASRIVLNNCTLTNINIGVNAGNGSTFGQSNTTFTNVNTEFVTEQNATQDQVSGSGGGEGLSYDKRTNLYSTGLKAWGGTPFATSSYAWAANRSGTADFSYLVPNSTTARFLVGNVSNNAYFRQDWDVVNTRITFVINGSLALRVTPTDTNSGSDNTKSLGSGVARWSVVHAGTGTINTSDAREKQQIRELSDAERAVAVRLKSLIRAFKFNDAVETKGDKARIHVGVIAQDVKAAFEAEGLVAEDYAVLCYDEWDEQPEVVETWDDEFDGDGNLIRPAGSIVTEAYRPAGNRYGVRYEELLAFIIGAM